MLAGYMLYQKRLIDDKFVDTLSQVLVKLLFPALIISKTIAHFSFSEYGSWWVLPLSAAVFCLVGMAIGRVILVFLRSCTSRREFMTSCGFQNCGYLPMNLIIFAFSGLLADRLLIYLFLFVLGFNVLMWSLVPLFFAGKLNKVHIRPSVFFNAPVVATVFALLWVAIFGRGTIPHIIADPLRQLGQSSFPIAMITLGAYLNRHRAFRPEAGLPLISALVVKLFVFPALVLGLFMLVPVRPDYRFFLFLQAIMPTAVSLVVIGGYTGADNRFLSGAIFYSHLLAIFTIPLWLMLYRIVIP